MSKEALAPAKEKPKEEPKNPADLAQDWTFAHWDKKEVNPGELEQDYTFSYMNKKPDDVASGTMNKQVKKRLNTGVAPAETPPEQVATETELVEAEVKPIETTDQARISPLGAKWNLEGRILDGSIVKYQGFEWILKDYDAFSGDANLVKKLPDGVQPGEGDITQISQKELYSLFGRSVPSTQETPVSTDDSDKPILDLSEAKAPKDRFFIGEMVWHDNHQWKLEGFDMETGEARLETEIIRRNVSARDSVTGENKIIPEEKHTVHIKVPQDQLYKENKLVNEKTIDTDFGQFTESEIEAAESAQRIRKAQENAERARQSAEAQVKIEELRGKIANLDDERAAKLDNAKNAADRIKANNEYLNQKAPLREELDQNKKIKRKSFWGRIFSFFE